MVPLAPKAIDVPLIVIAEFANLAFAIEPAKCTLSTDPSQRIDSLLNWSNAVDEYPKGDLF